MEMQDTDLFLRRWKPQSPATLLAESRDSAEKELANLHALSSIHED